MGKLKKIPDNSNGLTLKPKELVIAAAAVLALVLVLVPYGWMRLKSVSGSVKQFRLAEELRDDYYGYEMTSRAMCEKFPAVFLGDSVIWGKYVDNENTLPELLNMKIGSFDICNLAVDGLHPVAMERLLRGHGDGIRGKRVYLYWNPLWMNTPLYDLSGTEEFSINHPRLLPQFDPSFKSYRASFGDRWSTQLEQSVGFCAWLRHFRAAYCGNKDVKSVIASGNIRQECGLIAAHYRPYENRKLVNGTENWEKSGIKKQDWPWVEAKNSRQYAAFRRVIALLEKRGNKVTVVLGTVNPYMQTPGSLERYHRLHAEVKGDLEKAGIGFIDLPELASSEYADASHPLAPGYRKLADFMHQQLQKGDKTK